MHVDSIIKNGILLEMSLPYLDFGPGFYTTPQFEFAKNTAEFRTTWENRKAGFDKYVPVVFKFECNVEELKNLRVRRFEAPSNTWGHFVIANRAHRDFVRKNTAHNFRQKYDCVIGPTADGRSGMIDTLVDLVENGRVPLYKINCKSIFPSDSASWGEQYSFHTKPAISCLTFKDVIYCSQSEVLV